VGIRQPSSTATAAQNFYQLYRISTFPSLIKVTVNDWTEQIIDQLHQQRHEKLRYGIRT
jgi:hypothetical protein